MTPNQFAELRRDMAQRWPSSPDWPDESVQWLFDQVAPFTLISGLRALAALEHNRAPKERDFCPSPSRIATAISDFSDYDPNHKPKVLGGCDHVDAHEPARLHVPTRPLFVPASVPEDQRELFLSPGPTVLGGELRCLRCRRVTSCPCGACTDVRTQAAALLEEASA